MPLRHPPAHPPTREPAEPPRDPFGEIIEVLQAIRHYLTPSEISPLWRAEGYTLTASVPKTIVTENLQRRRCLIFTDSTNASGVAISPAHGITAVAARNGVVVLGPGAPALEFTHPGQVIAFATTAATVYVIEEYGAR